MANLLNIQYNDGDFIIILKDIKYKNSLYFYAQVICDNNLSFCSK